MNDIKITVDSTSDLSRELIERFGIAGVIPLYVTYGDECRSDDGVSVTNSDILNYVAKTKKLPKTSASSVEDFKAFFKKHTADGSAVLHFSISACLSVSYENALTAAKEFPSVHVLDCGQLSTGTALFALYARDLINENPNMPAEEVAKKVKARSDKGDGQSSFVIDTLDYLHKGGRCSLFQLFGANLLRLHPSLHLEEGKIKVGKKFRGKMPVVVDNYLELLKEQNPSYDDTRCFLTHSSGSPELVEGARAKIKKLFKFKEILVTEAGSTIFCHCGKETLGLLFLRK